MISDPMTPECYAAHVEYLNSMEINLVGYRDRNGGAWRSINPSSINEARSCYDAGIAELATGYDAKYCYLFCFPRAEPIKRKLNHRFNKDFTL